MLSQKKEGSLRIAHEMMVDTLKVKAMELACRKIMKDPGCKSFKIWDPFPQHMNGFHHRFILHGSRQNGFELHRALGITRSVVDDANLSLNWFGIQVTDITDPNLSRRHIVFKVDLL